MALGALLGAAGGILGGIAGGQKDSVTQRTKSGINVAPETAFEQFANPDLLNRYKQMGGLVDAGAGQQDVTAGLQGQRGLAEMLGQYSKGGFMPTEADYATAGGFADATLGASFRQQETQAARLSAQLGRPVNDPILQAKLRQGLGEQRGAMVAQEARMLPMQRLGFMSQMADVQQSLAAQAMANRQALMGMGSTLREQDRGYRIATGERYGESTQESGGGLKGAIGGALGGIGAGLGMASGLKNLGISSLSDIFGGGASQMGANVPGLSQIAAAPAMAQSMGFRGMTSGVGGEGGFGGPMLSISRQASPVSRGAYSPKPWNFGESFP